MKKVLGIIVLLGTVTLIQAQQGVPSAPLKEVTQIQIVPTVINDSKKIDNPDAVPIVEKALRRAILANELQVAESAPVKARIVLDEFSGGNFAKRFLIGYGAGRSTVDCRIQLLNQSQDEIASVRVRVRGDMAWGAYQGNATQTKLAVNKFDQALMDDIEKWKGSEAQAKPASGSPVPGN